MGKCSGGKCGNGGYSYPVGSYTHPPKYDPNSPPYFRSYRDYSENAPPTKQEILERATGKIADAIKEQTKAVSLTPG